jgi:DNA-binding transcriptional LysR family regulator
LELTPLRYFVAIARAGHMTRAARALGVSQPALSAMLRKLERESGADLMHRTGRGVELTEAGRVFLQSAEEAVLAADAGLRAVRELAGLERGSIRVGGGATAITYMLPRVVSDFRRSHPGLRFYVREAGSSAVAASVVSGELDLGIVTLPISANHEADLFTAPLVADELRLIVPPSHRLAGKRAFRWSDLKDQAVVAFEAGSAVRAVIDEASHAAGVTLDVAMELRSIESIKQMVAAGIGVGFVSRFALGSQQGLACREGRLSRSLAIVRRRDRLPSPAVATFERRLVLLVAASGGAGRRADGQANA